VQRRDPVARELARLFQDRVDEVLAQIAELAGGKRAERPATDFSVWAISPTGALYMETSRKMRRAWRRCSRCRQR
jgi:hypothetical protein